MLEEPKVGHFLEGKINTVHVLEFLTHALKCAFAIITFWIILPKSGGKELLMHMMLVDK